MIENRATTDQPSSQPKSDRGTLSPAIGRNTSPHARSSSLLSHPKYRADIDGLRAIAVLSVVVFHAFPGWAPGGFVGVDIFFVISGYLISTIIFGSLDKGSFSFIEFYSRRIKRIFPALMIALGGCSVLGWFILLPNEYKQLGEHIAAGAGFVSNFILWSESGYFDSAAATKPLLHLWSLGIEEQFYIAWPLILAFAWKRRIHLLLLTLAVLMSSFVLNIVFIWDNPIATFYNPVTRFWEILLGSALAYITLQKQNQLVNTTPRVDTTFGAILDKMSLLPDSTTLSNIKAFVGVGLIAVPIFLLHTESAFPGWLALLPTVGTYLLIAVGPEPWLNRTVLSHRVMVWFGLISFPLYLWHWPLLSFAQIVEASIPSRTIRLVVILLSVALAWLTYKCIEKPIRFGKHNKTVVTALLASATAMLVIGLSIFATEGFAVKRGPWNLVNIAQSYGKQDQYSASCLHTESAIFAPKFKPDRDMCHATLLANPKIDVIVLGDSHANRLYLGLQVVTEVSMLNLGRGSCLPLIGFEASVPGQEQVLFCSPTVEQLIDRALELSPRVVILNGFFARAYNGQISLRTDKPVQTMMRETLMRLATRIPRIVVVFDVPELPFDPSSCVDRPFNRVVGTEPGRCTFSTLALNKVLALYERDFREAAHDIPNVVFFNPADVLCDVAQCLAVKENHLLYDDRHHLSRHGAYLVGKALKAHLD